MRRISKSEIPDVKKMMLNKQKGVCPICGQSLLTVPSKDQVLDHCHTSGYIRGVLHRGCNGAEGKVRQVMSSWGRSGYSEAALIKALENMVNYWKVNQTPQTDLVHPSHLTGPERMVLANKLAASKPKGIRRRS